MGNKESSLFSQSKHRSHSKAGAGANLDNTTQSSRYSGSTATTGRSETASGTANASGGASRGINSSSTTIATQPAGSSLSAFSPARYLCGGSSSASSHAVAMEIANRPPTLQAAPISSQECRSIMDDWLGATEREVVEDWQQRRVQHHVKLPNAVKGLSGGSDVLELKHDTENGTPTWYYDEYYSNNGCTQAGANWVVASADPSKPPIFSPAPPAIIPTSTYRRKKQNHGMGVEGRRVRDEDDTSNGSPGDQQQQQPDDDDDEVAVGSLEDRLHVAQPLPVTVDAVVFPASRTSATMLYKHTVAKNGGGNDLAEQSIDAATSNSSAGQTQDPRSSAEDVSKENEVDRRPRAEGVNGGSSSHPANSAVDYEYDAYSSLPVGKEYYLALRAEWRRTDGGMVKARAGEIGRPKSPTSEKDLDDETILESLDGAVGVQLSPPVPLNYMIQLLTSEWENSQD